MLRLRFNYNTCTSDNLGNLIGVGGLELYRDAFVSPIANIAVYLGGDLNVNDNFGFDLDSDEQMVNLLNNISFLKNFMVNIESIVDGLFTVTEVAAVKVVAVGIQGINNVLLFRIGWMAGTEN